MDVVVSNLVNTMYCRDAGKKLRTANQVKWRKGITTASAAPFGYQFDPDKKGAFIIDLPAAKIVRRIFDLAILGLGTREIAVMLNDENVPVPSVYNKENKAYGKETTYTIAPVILWDSSRGLENPHGVCVHWGNGFGQNKNTDFRQKHCQNSSQRTAVYYGGNP